MPVNTTIEFRPLEVFRHLDDLANNQVPFALSQTINAAAKAFQADEKQGIRDRFMVRRPWVADQVKIVKFSDKKERPIMTAIIQLSDAGADILGKFEDGGQKTPERARSIAAPASAAFPREQIIPKAQRPPAMALTESGNTTKGADGTFLITRRNGSRAIFQRTGKERGDIKLLFSLLPNVPISPLLMFQETAQAVIPGFLKRKFPDFFAKARATAK